MPGFGEWRFLALLTRDRLEEQKRRLPESSYRQLFLKEWVESEDMLTTLDDLKAAVVLDGSQQPVAGRRYVVGLDWA